MVATQVTLDIPYAILKGLENGTYERIGGVIREVGSKKVVAWLRETSDSTLLSNLGGGIPGGDIVNGVIANIQLGQANLKLVEIDKKLQTVLGLTQLNTAVGLANLGISAIGFAIVITKLNQIEDRIKHLQLSISELQEKIDNSFLSKIKSAVSLADISIKMRDVNRKQLVSEVIQPLIEAQHYYQIQCDSDWSKRNGILGHEYILVLSLAYVTEAKCYLELGENEIALERIAEAEKTLRPRIKRYVKHLLTENPSGYLHSVCKEISLSDIMDALKYTQNESDPNKLFDQYIRKSICNSLDLEKWINTLPKGVRDAALVHIAPSLVGQDWSPSIIDIWNNRKKAILELMSQAHKVIAVIKYMIELDRRLESYRYEINNLTQLGLTYREWRELIPPPANLSDSSKLVMILPDTSK